MKFSDFIARFEKKVKTSNGFDVRCPAHEDKNASLSVAMSKDGGVVLHCHAGCPTPSVCAALGLTVKDLFVTEPTRRFTPTYKPVAAQDDDDLPPDDAPPEKPVIETTYSYTDAVGREVFQVVRMKPKTFRQRHKLANGEWVWKMEGIERVLYQLPKVLSSETVWIAEGEKDCDNLTRLGFVATCNPGGAGKWMDGYTDSLVGKDVFICGDNDEAGQKHVQLVFDSIARKVKSIRLVKLPVDCKDASDFIAKFKTDDEAKSALMDLSGIAVPHIGGVRMPVYSMADIEPMYEAQIANSKTVRLDLGDWLPKLKDTVRPLVPGELVLLLGNTGAGKTALLQNLAVHARKLKTLMFEMELPAELLFERFVAIRGGIPCKEVERLYTEGTDKMGSEFLQKAFRNLFICPESKLTLADLESIIIKSELKIGAKPALVLIDYIQLMQGKGSRYEKTSDIAEGLKVIAKSTKTIIVVSSQVSRPQADDPEISIHSGKDSGSLENSAGLVLAGWRDAENPKSMMLKVLKATKGGGGTEVECEFDGPTLRISQRATTIDRADVPRGGSND